MATQCGGQYDILWDPEVERQMLPGAAPDPARQGQELPSGGIVNHSNTIIITLARGLLIRA